ncbi:TetR/AcrR family transcriptional regulator [Gordonia humi]
MTAQQRQSQLLDIAERLFTEHGYEGVTMEDIAREAGITRPIVYRHLESREDAFLSCVRRARRQFEQSILDSATLPLDDLTARITAAGRSYLDMIEVDPQRWRLLFATSSGIDGYLVDQLAAMRAQTVEVIATAIRPYASGAAEESVEAFAYMVSGIGEQLGRWWLVRPEVSRDRVLAYYVAAIGGAAQATLELPPPPSTS